MLEAWLPWSPGSKVTSNSAFKAACSQGINPRQHLARIDHLGSSFLRGVIWCYLGCQLADNYAGSATKLRICSVDMPQWLISWSESHKIWFEAFQLWSEWINIKKSLMRSCRIPMYLVSIISRNTHQRTVQKCVKFQRQKEYPSRCVQHNPITLITFGFVFMYFAHWWYIWYSIVDVLWFVVGFILFLLFLISTWLDFTLCGTPEVW